MSNSGDAELRGCLTVLIWLIFAALVIWFFANFEFKCSDPYWDYSRNSVGYTCAWERRG